MALTIFCLALFMMYAPGSALAVKYYTQTGTVTATAAGSTISVSATYSTAGTNCGNGGDSAPTFNVEWDLTPADWTGTGYGSSGALADGDAASPFTYSTPNLSPGTYAVRVTYADVNGVNVCTTTTSVIVNAGSNVTIVANGLTVGTSSAVVNSSSQITATATYTNDLNGNSSTMFEYGTSSSGPWTAKCSTVSGASPRSCVIDGLNASTDYWVRVTHTDADGVTGTNPQVTGPYTTQSAIPCDKVVNDCADCHSMPPATDDHQVSAHQGGAQRADCAVCHVKYSPLTNVTSTARWTTSHTDRYLDIYTSNRVPNRLFISPYDKGIKGGYYKGYRNKTSIWGGKLANANNVCTATYCHGAGDSPIWGVGTASCGSCHNVSPAPAGGKHTTHTQGYAGYANKSNSSSYNFGCYKCHDEGSVGHSSGPLSSNQAAGVAFDNRTSPKNASGTYAAGSLAGADGTLNWTNGTCSNLYCHSDANGAYINPTWNGTLAANCLGCHKGNKAAGSGNIMATGRHTEHVNNADANIATFGCVQCHDLTVSADRTLSNRANHADETKDVYFSGYNGYTGSYSSGTCRNNYCHSSGQATPSFRTPSWSGTALTCSGCHGADNGVSLHGEPNYNNVSTASRNTFNGHTTHVSSDADCANCHRNTVDTGKAILATGKHLDGFRNVSFTKGGAYNTTLKRCSNTNCHGPSAVRWGGKLSKSCQSCHSDMGAGTYANHSSNGKHLKHVATYGFACELCHATTNASNNTVHAGGDVSSKHAAQVYFNMTASLWKTATYGGGATQYRYREMDKAYGLTGLSPLYQPWTTATALSDSVNPNRKFTQGRCTTVWCHSNAKPLGRSITYQSFPNWSTAETNTCNECHGWTGTFGNITLSYAHKKHAGSDRYNYTCSECHNDTVSTGNSPISNYTKHVDASKDVKFDGTNPSGSYASPTCSNLLCHGNGTGGTGNYAWNGSATTCTSCHPYSALATNKHDEHIAGGNLGRYKCGDCHRLTVQTNNTTINYANGLHVNSAKDVYFKSMNGYTGFYTASFTCRNNYCHSSGQATPNFRTAAAWNGATAYGCASCHGADTGFTATYGEPNYTNASTATRNAFNSHSTHVKATTDCYKCHYNSVDGSSSILGTGKHLDTFRNVSFSRGGTYNTTLKRCSNTNCHGPSPIRWGGRLAKSCQSCHSDQGAGTYTNHSTTSQHDKHVGVYKFACEVCHATKNASLNTEHAGGDVSTRHAAQVYFNTSATEWTNAVYGGGGTTLKYMQMDAAYGLAGIAPLYRPWTTTTALSDPVNSNRKWTQGRCENIWCHSNANPVGGTHAYQQFPNWSTIETTNCRKCHAGDKTASPTMSTGSHAQHVNNGDLGNLTCTDCHIYTVSSNTVIKNYGNHVNAVKNVNMTTISNYTGFYVSSTRTCRNVYCHSSGQDTSAADATPAFRNVVWNTTTLTCDGCHGAEGTSYVAGAPEYTNTSTASRAKFNGHYASGHVSAAGDCSRCHRSTVNVLGNISSGTVKHINGSPDIAFRSDIGGTYNTSLKRCTNVSCHTGATLRWGGVATCSDCHVVTSADVNDFTYNNGTKAVINFDQYTSVGHGRKGTYRYGTTAGANLSCTSSSDTATNGGCHRNSTAHGVAANPFRLVSSATIKPTSPNTLCTASCHSSAAIQNHEKAITGGTNYATWFFTPKCIDCHDPHGDNGGNDTTQHNYKMIQGFVNYSGASDAYGRPSYTRAMDFPAQTVRPVSLNRTSFATATYDGICQICHRRGFGAAFDRRTYSMTTHNPGMNCMTCHDHNAGFKGAGDCKGCHNQTQNGRPSIQTEFGKMSHHLNVDWATMQPSACSVCHMEGDSTGSPTSYHNNNVGGAYPVDLRIIATVGANEATTISNNTNSVQFFTGSGPNGGTRSAGNVANRHCGGCHNDANAASYPFTTSEGTSKKTPGAYDPTSAGSVFKRYSSSTTTKSHPYSPATYNVVGQLNKSYSPHGHPEKNQMKNVVSGAWSDDTQTVSNAVGCLDCHNSHGSSAGADEGTTNMITYNSSVGGYFGGLIRQTDTYDPDKTSAYNAVSDLCFDCHLGDDASAPKKYSDFGVGRTVHEYNDAGRWTTTDTWSGSFSYKNNDNTGKLRGGHFGASSALNNAASAQINGSCLACHDPHGTPYTNLVGGTYDRAYMAPALKGTWMSSPYKEDRVGQLNSSTLKDANTYSFSNLAGKQPPRESPAFAYNNPANIGAGFGTGLASLGTYAVGGTGHDGYFIDDNTFGNSKINDTTANPWSSAITGTYISQTDTQFGGLCLGCHSSSNLQSLSYSNGTDTIKVHNTVKGWATLANSADLFKPANANQHLMAYKASTASASNWCGTTHAYYPVPSGYRWSVNPGTQTSFTPARPGPTPLTDPPPGNTGQQLSGTKQYGYHQFPCAKCHAPHATKLKRLMKTNCLDVGPTEASGTHYPKHNTSYTMGFCDDGTGTATYKRAMVCHNQNKTNTSSGGGWNIKTGW